MSWITHYYKNELDYAVVEILNIKYPLNLRYKELEQEINLHLESKVSSSTLSRHLLGLATRNVLDKKQDRGYGPTHYSLTKEFKNSLDIQKKYYPKTYVKKTLSLSFYSDFHHPSDEPAIIVDKAFSEDE